MNARFDAADAPGAARADDAAIRKNMLQLVELRWIAVVGQVATIALVVSAWTSACRSSPWDWWPRASSRSTS
ncbi:hypothetical protein [Chenggangzhangella methanolivorans]|uniref:hypothetical protein n=1 Tax=Chenggangzhangella methanolivorans TaxID=1437009 RepID=UPI0021BD9FDF|nr:hypothetical protein [Chenggangzhangella methanolivorans]